MPVALRRLIVVAPLPRLYAGARNAKMDSRANSRYPITNYGGNTSAQSIRRARQGKLPAPVVEGTGISCEIVFASGEVERFGPGAPQFTVHFKNDRSLRYGFDEFASADAFVNGEIEVEGDLAGLLQLRTRIKDRVRFSASLKFIHSRLFKRETAVNREAISDHYQHGDEHDL